MTFVQSICSIGRSKPLPYRLVRGCTKADKMIICAKLFVLSLPPSFCLAAKCHRLAEAEGRLGSDSPPGCHSLPRRRFATSSDGGISYTHLETTSSVSPPMYNCTLYLYSGDPPSPTGEGLCWCVPFCYSENGLGARRLDTQQRRSLFASSLSVGFCDGIKPLGYRT